MLDEQWRNVASLKMPKDLFNDLEASCTSLCMAKNFWCKVDQYDPCSGHD